jgi:arginyl-tRNA--protein-N-Asp/Glu arginylyltransferase
LPTDALSSYDPEFGDWEFGKLSALREIALAIENDYQYYYMGADKTGLYLYSGRLH